MRRKTQQAIHLGTGLPQSNFSNRALTWPAWSDGLSAASLSPVVLVASLIVSTPRALPSRDPPTECVS